MNSIFKTLGISRQGFHQRLNRQFLVEEEQQQLLCVIHQVRADHPGMGAKTMYHLIQPSLMGRDRFEQFCFAYGFKLKVKRNFAKTTNSLGVTRFKNKIINIELTGINQIWVSDITYYRMGDKFYYLTFIMDLFSRYIVGYKASQTLLTQQTTLPALNMALKFRKPSKGLILHSDGGGQYYCKAFLALTKTYGIINSMGESAYENPHAERINGTIKNQYLYYYNPQTYAQLQNKLAKAVDLYNQERPHKALEQLSPREYENKMMVNI